MNWLDILLILMILLPVFIGYKRGLIGIILPLVGIVVGIFIAGRIYDNVSDWLHPGLLGSKAQADIVAFAIIFVLFFVAIISVSSQLRRFLNLLFLGWVDSLGGLLFGLILGSIGAGVLVAIVSRFFTSAQATVTDSALASFLLDTFPFVLHLLPSHFREGINPFF